MFLRSLVVALASEVVFLKMPSRNQKKRSKQQAEYLQKQDENKAKARALYKADPEKKASVRDSYKADPEKKKASVRDSYKADPEKKKASVRDSYKALSHLLLCNVNSFDAVASNWSYVADPGQIDLNIPQNVERKSMYIYWTNGNHFDVITSQLP